MLKLDLGAGDIKTEGYKRVDISDKCNPDFVWDVTKFPYPKEWEGCEAVRADNLFEHIEPKTLIKVINEIHRIMKPGGKLWIRVPQVKCTTESLTAAFTDPTHCNFFTLGTFGYWEQGHKRHKAFGKDYGIIPWSKVDVREWEARTIFIIAELTK